MRSLLTVNPELNRDLDGVRRRLADLKTRHDRAELEARVFDRPIPREVLRGLLIDWRTANRLLRLAITR